jgi:hypothetical protein
MDTSYKSTTVTTMEKQNLLAGDFPLVTRKAVLLSGQNLKRGAVLGKITVGGKLVLSDDTIAVANGSETPYAVLAQDTDATLGDKETIVYLTGQFNSNALIFGGDYTAENSEALLRALSIFVSGTINNKFV